MARRSQYSPEYLDALRDYYVESPVSLKELAAMTGDDEFPHIIDYETLRFYSRQGRWPTLKERYAHNREGLPQTVNDEIEDLREQVYDAIMDAENKPAPRDMASLISSYMSLQAAGSKSARSAKTGTQQAIDMYHKMKQEAEHGTGSTDD